MGLRKSWTGKIVFTDFVKIAVELYSATQDTDIHFNMLHNKCHTKIVEKKWCPECDIEVFKEDIVKGYKDDSDNYIPMEKEDIEEAQEENDKKLRIISYMDIQDIDPIYMKKNYFMAPEEGSEEEFLFFKESLEKSEKVAVGSFIYRNKRLIVMIRPYNNIILLTQLLYADQVKDSKMINFKQVKVGKEEIKQGLEIIAKNTVGFDIKDYTNTNKENLIKVIQSKTAIESKGKKEKSKKAEGAKTSRLMDKLMASAK